MSTIAPEIRSEHERWLLELTQIPTAAGQEQRVIKWINQWVAHRDDVELTTDPSGNLHIAMRAERASAEPPVYFTAHLDHPAFTVERVLGSGAVQLAFRGGVMDDYFEEARIVLHTKDDARLTATITGKPETGCAIFKSYLAELDSDEAEALVFDDVGTWELPQAEFIDGQIHTNACDDLAAAAAALAAFDQLREAAAAGEKVGDVRVLFTRAEEIGFIGAIAACRHETMPKGSRVIALENSRSFADSPIGGGPIVRVGDRISIFDPQLTAAIAKRAETIAGGPAQPTAAQKNSEMPTWNWQRKLMAGGACEATVFCAHGYASTCLCLPLGNYHNMADLAAAQAGTNTSRPRVGREHVAVKDYHGLVDLLIACGTELPSANPVATRLEKLWEERAFVLGG